MVRRIKAPLQADLSKKLVLLSGPRQAGKTTLSKTLSATKEGYEISPTTVVVNKGERTDLKVTLTAIAQLKKAS